MQKILTRLKYSFFNKQPSSIFTKDLISGENFQIGEYTYGKPIVLYQESGASLIIGKFCSFAENTTIFLGGNHRTDWVSTYPFREIFTQESSLNTISGHPSTNGDVIIKNDVWIGRNATILSGVKIENGAVIGAGSLVTKDIGPYEIWGGNPAKLIRKRFDEETIKALLDIKWWDWEYNKIISHAPSLCNNNIFDFISQHRSTNK
ncbi:MAG: CatB-related O-acetyltransferase [Bacteroidetes bacterium]|nr:CatB-related O-acetyltransferase [Bacteroidota bacterium]